VSFPLPPTMPHPTVGESAAQLTPEDHPWAGGFPELRPRRSGWNRWGRHLVLFVLTAISVFLTGALRFTVEPGRGPALILETGEGLKLAGALLSILMAHEMGHYLACRYYHVDATLPFFIPAPLINSLVGTLGALIRIRGPIPHRRALFDIGIAGPLAGFAVCLPVLWLGVGEAQLVPGETAPGGLLLGEPLLFQWAVLGLRGATADGLTLTLGPLGLAAWFGLFVTALNMIPVGQLDGGHVTYALVPSRAVWISRLGTVACLVLLTLHPFWLVWSLLLLLLGRRPHPPTLDDQAPLGRARVAIGIFGFIVFALCFTPSPVVLSWSDFLLSLTSR
jgi:membrane-associated protease RseP (regulator of RpoE activity)